MTTYTFYGFTILGEETFSPGGAFQISVPVGVKDISYFITEPADPDGDRGALPRIAFDLPDAATTRLDGDFMGSLEFELGAITHSGGTAVILLADIDTEPNFGEDRTFISLLSGDLNVTNQAQLEEVAGSIQPFDGTLRDGPLAVDAPIDFDFLPQVEISNADLLIGGETSEKIKAGNGSDILIGGDGADTLDGGKGFDILDYFVESEPPRETETFAIRVDAVRKEITDSYGNTDSYNRIEAIYGSINADTFLGPDKGTLTVTGSQFHDTIKGGDGELIVDYSPEIQWGGGQGIVTDLSKKTSTDGFGDTDRLVNVDGVIGTAAKDVMKAGDDDVQFWGGRAKDKLTGGKGDDWLSGERGNDVLSGKAGRDTFVFERKMDKDRVTDFNPSKDRLEIDDGLLAKKVTTSTKLVNRYGEVDGDDVVLDFGNGDLVRLTGLETLDGLADRIDIV